MDEGSAVKRATGGRRQGLLRFELRAKCGDLLVLGLYGLTGLVGQARFALFQLYRFLLGGFGLLPGLGGFFAKFFGLVAAGAGCLQVFQGGLGRRSAALARLERMSDWVARASARFCWVWASTFSCWACIASNTATARNRARASDNRTEFFSCVSLDLGLSLGGAQFPLGAFAFRLFLRQLGTLAFVQEGDGFGVAARILAGPIGVPTIRTAPGPGPMQIGVRPDRRACPLACSSAALLGCRTSPPTHSPPSPTVEAFPVGDQTLVRDVDYGGGANFLGLVDGQEGAVGRGIQPRRSTDVTSSLPLSCCVLATRDVFERRGPAHGAPGFGGSEATEEARRGVALLGGKRRPQRLGMLIQCALDAPGEVIVADVQSLGRTIAPPLFEGPHESVLHDRQVFGISPALLEDTRYEPLVI